MYHFVKISNANITGRSTLFEHGARPFNYFQRRVWTFSLPTSSSTHENRSRLSARITRLTANCRRHLAMQERSHSMTVVSPSSWFVKTQYESLVLGLVHYEIWQCNRQAPNTTHALHGCFWTNLACQTPKRVDQYHRCRYGCLYLWSGHIRTTDILLIGTDTLFRYKPYVNNFENFTSFFSRRHTNKLQTPSQERFTDEVSLRGHHRIINTTAIRCLKTYPTEQIKSIINLSRCSRTQEKYCSRTII